MSKQVNKTSLSEKDGIAPPDNISETSVSKVRSKRRKKQDVSDLVKGILKGDTTALSRSITLVESSNPEHMRMANEIIDHCLPFANNSIRIGITGVPGVGKSTFIETFGKQLTAAGKKVAVLAVDPSSSISKGSILGDKTRMEELVKDRNAFIRPSASGNSLGGVARKTRETVILCEACGFNTIIIETVGVGQSETAVHSMVDFFLLLKLAGAGDELQGIKRGIMEMADAVVINKADGNYVKAARQAKADFTRALHLYPPKSSNWTPRVLTASALQLTGIKEVGEMIEEFIAMVTQNGYLEQNRIRQNKNWLIQTIDEMLKTDFYEHPEIKPALAAALKEIEQNRTSPFQAARSLFELYK